MGPNAACSQWMERPLGASEMAAHQTRPEASDPGAVRSCEVRRSAAAPVSHIAGPPHGRPMATAGAVTGNDRVRALPPFLDELSRANLLIWAKRCIGASRRI